MKKTFPQINQEEIWTFAIGIESNNNLSSLPFLLVGMYFSLDLLCYVEQTSILVSPLDKFVCSVALCVSAHKLNEESGIPVRRQNATGRKGKDRIESIRIRVREGNRLTDGRINIIL